MECLHRPGKVGERTRGGAKTRPARPPQNGHSRPFRGEVDRGCGLLLAFDSRQYPTAHNPAARRTASTATRRALARGAPGSPTAVAAPRFPPPFPPKAPEADRIASCAATRGEVEPINSVPWPSRSLARIATRFLSLVRRRDSSINSVRARSTWALTIVVSPTVSVAEGSARSREAVVPRSS